MIRLIEIRTLPHNQIVHIHKIAIDAIYQDTNSTYGILMRSGVSYHISQLEFNRLLRVFDFESRKEKVK